MASKKPTELTAREANFAHHFVLGELENGTRGNQARAAIAAGYSERSAKQIACRLMKEPRIVAAIDALQKQVAAQLGYTAERVLGRLSTLSVRAEAAGQYSAAVGAEKLIGQHLKLFTEKHEHGGIGGGPVVMHVTKEDEDL